MAFGRERPKGKSQPEQPQQRKSEIQPGSRFVARQDWGEAPVGRQRNEAQVRGQHKPASRTDHGKPETKKNLDRNLSNQRKSQPTQQRDYSGTSAISGVPFEGNRLERHHDERPKRDGGKHTIPITAAEHVAAHIVRGVKIEDQAAVTGKNKRRSYTNPDLDLMGRLNELDDEGLQEASSRVSKDTGTNVRFY